jgi:phosphatidylserine/phosphatidylglycerophosphate/cardiolipin synthase-like enzyme
MPPAERPVSPAGHYGSLHAKVAVADAASLLISSANLTEYAMQHFARLIEMGILEPMGTS